MKPEDINRAIAEHCGWREDSPNWWIPPGVAKVERCPNYHADLNAMQEAEKVLDDTNGGTDSPDCLRYVYSWYVYAMVPNDTQPFRANSAIRAEAFLRTVGKWKDQ